MRSHCAIKKGAEKAKSFFSCYRSYHHPTSTQCMKPAALHGILLEGYLHHPSKEENNNDSKLLNKSIIIPELRFKKEKENRKKENNCEFIQAYNTSI
jgi:hypothetical protein